MHTKLTLRIDAPLIKAAKKYSAIHGRSLSTLVADYLLLITTQSGTIQEKEVTPPLTQALQGILRGKKVSDADYRNYLDDKYK